MSQRAHVADCHAWSRAVQPEPKHERLDIGMSVWREPQAQGHRVGENVLGLLAGHLNVAIRPAVSLTRVIPFDSSCTRYVHGIMAYRAMPINDHAVSQIRELI